MKGNRRRTLGKRDGDEGIEQNKGDEIEQRRGVKRRGG